MRGENLLYLTLQVNMADYSDEIIRKYRRVAHLPDFLFSFTFPLRRQAVERLQLEPGAHVLEVGCSTGANFAYLLEAIGPSGKVVGVDLSPDMVEQARLRVKREGWDNVEIVKAGAEDFSYPGKFDGLMLFAMHDVITSNPALDNILTLLKEGGRVVASGPKLSTKGMSQALNPMIHMVYKRFSISTMDKDQPWRSLSERIENLQVEELGKGLIYLVFGTT